MTYLNATEIESAQVALAGAHPGICELITLPHQTFEGRTSHALRIGKKPAGTVEALYLTGGVHAREWGSSDILINLATDLCTAYAANGPITYNGKVFSPAEVRAVVEQMNIIIFPCVNPDGRAYSQTVASGWRKNRNTANSGGVASRIGVDINRNQPWLWDFATAFNPAAVNSYLSSSNPADDTYHGPSPVSEPETKNINHLHDTIGKVRWYIDVHSYSEDLLTPWGDDESQTNDPAQSFTNGSFNGHRGLIGGDYSEFLPNGDAAAVGRLSSAFTRTLAEVRGKFYVAKPSFSLYPTSGTNGDWAYSRHFSDSSKSKTLGFTLEWGTEFQPPYSEMEHIIRDVCAGFIGLALSALGIESRIVSNRDSFSSFEVETQSSYPASLYAIYDGFSPASLGLPGSKPTVRIVAADGSAIPSITGSVSNTELQNPASPGSPQRITFTLDLAFANLSAFQGEQRPVYALVEFAGRRDVAQLQLLMQPNPYMLDGPTSWISTDLRVFQLKPGAKANANSAVQLGDIASDANAPFTFLHAVLNEMRAAGNASSPVFDAIATDQQASRLEAARTVGGKRVLNFAIAKVRYRAAAQDASGVRVFFRMFNAMNSDMSYDTRTGSAVQNYRRSSNGSAPLLGINTFFSGAGSQIVSIPFFADPRVDTSTASMATQIDPWNTRTIVHAAPTESVEYFGCWLDFNQTEPRLSAAFGPEKDGPFANRVSILSLVRGLHQCLVAEVRFQPGAGDPIPLGANPASSDRLAQRNLAIVDSDNPGGGDAHLVQHTISIKPSTAPSDERKDGAEAEELADELVIRWNGLPVDTQATLYFPDFSADEIVELARAKGGDAVTVTRVDEHTVACEVGAISFLPIPAHSRPVAPGLLTLRLPDTVRAGERFTIDVQQHSGTTRVSRSAGRVAAPAREENIRGSITLSARKVIGAFQIQVNVSQGKQLTRRVVRNLAVLRYIQTGIPATDSWRPVFDRYVSQTARQVTALGVDPTLVPASADDPWRRITKGRGGRTRLIGKVVEVDYDCFGDFTGFVLSVCGELHRLQSTERAVERIAIRAFRRRLLLRVELNHKERRLGRIAVVFRR